MTTSNLSDTSTTRQSPLPSQCDSEKFIKFPKIENLENEFRFPTEEEQKEHCVYIVATEKLDGANLGVYIPRIGLPSFYSRNGLNADGLYNFSNDKTQLVPFVEIVQGYLQFLGQTNGSRAQGIWFWGEYFGNGVMNRVKYNGKRGRVMFYDAMLDMPDRGFLNPFVLDLLVDAVDSWAAKNGYEDGAFARWFLKNKYVPRLETVTKETLREFYPLPCKSEFSDSDNREGWVVTMFSENGFYRRWKIKDEKFSETRIPSKASVHCPVLSRLRELFKGYVTLNRAQGILTKTPERRKIDKLVKMLIQDAREDFMHDHGAELEGFDDKMIRKVFNAGADPFMRIKEAIALEVR